MGKYLIRENNKISHNILQERIKIGNNINIIIHINFIY